MFTEFLNIIVRSLKLDNTLYKDKKNFSDSAIYFASLIVILTIIIQTIPNNTYINWMSEYGLWQKGMLKFRETLLWGLFFWLLKSLYFYFVGKVVFPNKKVKFSFVKILTITGFAHAPLIFNFLAFNKALLYILFFTFIWYIASQTVAINVIFDYKNKLKSFLIVIAPLLIFFLSTIFYISTII